MSDPRHGRLIFGDDRSATADVVWEWIGNHSWPGWTIAVVSADDAPDVTILPPDHVALTAWEPPDPRRLADGEATSVEHLRGRADPRVVLDSAGPADLMVVGPRGRGLMKQLGVGSTADWLLQRPDPPVAVIRSSATTRQVVAYADGRPDGERAIAALASLPWIASCEVVVLATEDAHEAAATALLHDAGVPATVRHVAVPRRTLGRAGDPAPAVLREILALRPDLVALGVGSFEAVRRAFRATSPTESTLSVLVAARATPGTYEPTREGAGYTRGDAAVGASGPAHEHQDTTKESPMAGETARTSTTEKPVVTIFEQYGAGADYVGTRVADALHLPYHPQAFSSRALEGDAEAATEEGATLAQVFSVLGGAYGGLEGRDIASTQRQKYELTMDNNRTVWEHAQEGGVIVGRNGAVVLAERPRTVHVLLTGSVEDRVERAAREAGISPERAAARQQREDQVRADMSLTFYGWDPRLPDRYDLVINTSRISLDAAVSAIVEAVRTRTS